MDYNKLSEKKKHLDVHRPMPRELVQNLDAWFKVELTYTSNALEGNTLTRRETALVVEKGLTVGGKTLKEHLEAVNHSKALDFVHEFVGKKPKHVRASEVLQIHRSLDIYLKSMAEVI